MKIDFWNAVTQSYIKAYLKDGREYEGRPIICDEPEEDEKIQELCLVLENDHGMQGFYESECDRLEFIDWESGKLIVMQ